MFLDFFVFKQKTAYEMRISDWSSDVCSSDLQVVTKWPKSNWASYAQNRLGRAYLDEDKPSLAAVAFYNNYKDRPNGARAPHSLMYMGIALTELGSKADACKAFRELEEVYGDKAPKDVRDEARSEEHTSELQPLLRNSYARLSLKKK